MAIVEQSEEELAAMGECLAAWLQDKMPRASNIGLVNFRRPGGSGFSNDTLLGDVHYSQDGQDIVQSIVIRIGPPEDGHNVFPFYDIPRQFDIMKAIGDHSDVKVPECLWKSTGSDVLGAPFYVMAFVAGDIPADNPPFGKEGFVKDASPEQRRALWLNALKEMAALHQLDFKKVGLGFLGWENDGRSPIAKHLEFYEHYFDWAREGRDIPVAQAGLQYLRDNMPEGEPEVIVWGDARIGNVIFDDFKVAALLDWEMAATGSPEVDLAWFLLVDEVNRRGNGMPGMEFDRLEGMPLPEETVAFYEEQTGHKVKHLHYYEVLAAFRFACVMIRLMQRVGIEGLIPEEFVPVLERNNVVTQIMAELLDLPPPE